MADKAAPRFELDDDRQTTRVEDLALGPKLRSFLKPLASLKLTVVLFGLAIVIVFAGTLAQTQHDIWFVVDHYFRTPVAWIDLQVFFPKSFFPGLPPVPGSIPFPGGWLIGAAMAVNLLAAHAVRFTYQAKGGRLTTGMGVLGLGVLTTGLVVAGGSSEGVQGVPFFEWSTLWTLCKFSLAALCIVGAWGASQLDAARVFERRALYGLAATLAGFVLWLMAKGDAVALGDSSMRILWQLIQGLLAGGVLLAGCWLVFQKRAGIVLLHGGIGLMMLSELMVGTSAVESQMSIREGDTCNFVQDSRFVELAVIDRSDKETDTVVTIPQSRLDEGTKLLDHAWLPRSFVKLFPVSLRSSLGGRAEEVVIADEKLPFDVKVVKYLQNADVRPIKGGEANPATAGLGLQLIAEEVEKNVGASSSSKIDDSAIYVELIEKATQKSLGTYLLDVLQARLLDSRDRSGMQSAEIVAVTGPFLAKRSAPIVVKVGDQSYELALRFKRYYKPFSMTLLDVRTTYYPGTTTPRDYSSTLQLVDRGRDVDRQVKVWMNNPLRFAGETFYQSSVGPDPITGAETTGLQVVTNTGWMIPYVSCMIVGVGMLFQFGQTLLRFLKRREAAETILKLGTMTLSPVAIATGLALKRERELRDDARAAHRRVDSDESLDRDDSEAQRPRRWIDLAIPICVAALCLVFIVSQARPPKPAADGIDLYAAGKLPLLYQGRAKPLDTLARNTLQIISNKETFVGPMDSATLRKNWSVIEKRVKKQWSELAGADLSKLIDDPQPIVALADLVESETKLRRMEIDDFLYKATAQRQPPIRWLMDVVSGRSVPAFRVEDAKLQKMLGLEPRQNGLYSLAEIRSHSDEMDEAVAEAGEKPSKTLSSSEQALLKLDQRVRDRLIADRHRVFRIENLEVLDMLGLERREGFLYSLAEIRPRSEKFNQEVAKVQKKPLSSLSVYERKLLDLDRRIRSFTAVDATFRRPNLPAQPTSDMRDLVKERRTALKGQLNSAETSLIENGHPPLVVPVRETEGGSAKFQWKPYVSAWTRDYFESRILAERPADAAVAGWDAILTAYETGEAEEFNRAVRKYQTLMADESPPELQSAKIGYEVYFNWFAPFFQAWMLYILVFVLSVLGWLFSSWRLPLQRAAFWLAVITLLLHTFALVSRIYISGRPPVTNLYSSAVFIGWGCVGLGLALEAMYRLGIGNAIAAIAGFATLFISFTLAGDGDTFTVMQAVLDTQFWLATHVTCITLGYATTYLSGLLGAFYILRGIPSSRWRRLRSLVVLLEALGLHRGEVQPTIQVDVGKSLARMVYGTLCFALFFSFVGTVLGGLWADDSWGRFWGWDPKENGALIIVLWNALVLHARWDGMVKDRGLCVLAVGGNIVTSWSWFGVNELGVGLHSYGFTEGVLRSLGVFVASQLALIAIGARPKAYWRNEVKAPA